MTTVVLAHGAGAGQDHPWMRRVVRAFETHGLSAVTFNFPYKDAGRSAPDRPAVLEAHFEKVWAEAARKARGPMIAAGKSIQLLIEFFTSVPGDYGASGALIPQGGEAITVPLTGEVQPTPDAFEADDSAAAAKTVTTDGTVTTHTLHTLSGTTGGRGFDAPALATAADVDFSTFTLASTTSVAPHTMWFAQTA